MHNHLILNLRRWRRHVPKEKTLRHSVHANRHLFRRNRSNTPRRSPHLFQEQTLLPSSKALLEESRKERTFHKWPLAWDHPTRPSSNYRPRNNK
jgi:hypothetical protein